MLSLTKAAHALLSLGTARAADAEIPQSLFAERDDAPHAAFPPRGWHLRRAKTKHHVKFYRIELIKIKNYFLLLKRNPMSRSHFLTLLCYFTMNTRYFPMCKIRKPHRTRVAYPAIMVSCLHTSHLRSLQSRALSVQDGNPPHRAWLLELFPGVQHSCALSLHCSRAISLLVILRYISAHSYQW